MTTTVTESVLRGLAGFRAVNGCAVSLYLDLDPASTPTSDTRFHAALVTVHKQGERISDGRRECRMAIRDDLARLNAWWEDELTHAGARGFAVFASAADDFFRALQLPDPPGDAVHVGSSLHVTPIVGQFSDDGSLVAAVSRERGTLYRVQSGRLVELLDNSLEQPGRHDQGGWSQARYQRHIETLVLRHLKAVSTELDRTVRQLGAGLGIVVVAPEEARAELERELSHETRRAIVGSTSAEAHAGPADLLALARPFFDQARARLEHDVLERWQEARGRGERSAEGWQQVLDAAADGRVETLLLEERSDRQVWECPRCGRASVEPGLCPVDEVAFEEPGEGADAAIRQTVAHGGTFVRLAAGALGDGAEIGALLRY
jgi:peptide chain release factor subunit 1